MLLHFFLAYIIIFLKYILYIFIKFGNAIKNICPRDKDESVKERCRVMFVITILSILFSLYNANQLYILSIFLVPPKVSLSLKTYSSSTLSEGDTVALICRVLSNPLAGPVQWSFVKESSVLPKQDDFPKSGTHTLVLERLEPWHKGSYRCRATNSEGSGESNALWLAIRRK